MKFFLLLIFPIHFISTCFAQDIGAYTDFNGRLMVFQDGNIRQIEDLPVRSFKVAGKFLAYISNNNMLRAYYNGVKFSLEEGAFIKDYRVMQGMVVYFTGRTLKVLDKDGRKTLTSSCDFYECSDSLVYFKDEYSGLFKIYGPSGIAEINDVKIHSLGQNIFAYADNSDNFYVIENSTIKKLESREPAKFKAGKFVVAFVDPSDDSFKVYQNGETFMVSPMPPKSFQAGNGMVAFVDNTSNFLVYSNGKIFNCLTTIPDFYELREQQLAFFAAGRFYIFSKGVVLQMEDHIPSNMALSQNYIAYQDYFGKLKVVDQNIPKIISVETVKSFSVMNQYIYYKLGSNDHHFYFNGKIY